MRPLYCLIIGLFTSACTGKKINDHTVATANANAKQWAAKNLADTPGYKPLGFDGPDSIILSYRNDSAYIRLEDSIMQIEALRFQEMGENFKLFNERKESGYYERKQAGFRKLQAGIIKKVKPQFIGYKIEHHFTVTDSSGAALLNKYVLYFDRQGNLTKAAR
ncbi:hypothetical protein LJ707_12255 [Mucilaginibacter sp. UR6-1]|uniref:hypothetical protein n=1 Tax=Mucilaginibacter sp. UR6-1 TaxID=1435643 RepID=UPI001E2D0BEB|nr:hypothetical protein [Mucilaginibacter sp. UR6-1]MCC8409703.1 hypothetical protein [Mucilaginibacter sp. UR6-1]